MFPLNSLARKGLNLFEFWLGSRNLPGSETGIFWKNLGPIQYEDDILPV